MGEITVIGVISKKVFCALIIFQLVQWMNSCLLFVNSSSSDRFIKIV